MLTRLLLLFFLWTKGGAKSYPGSVQDSYSLGRQFPPFNKIDKPDAVLSVFERGFVVPLRFRYDKDVENSGIKLKRYRRLHLPHTHTHAHTHTPKLHMH